MKADFEKGYLKMHSGNTVINLYPAYHKHGTFSLIETSDMTCMSKVDICYSNIFRILFIIRYVPLK